VCVRESWFQTWWERIEDYRCLGKGEMLWVIFGREMSVDRIVYKEMFQDLCSSLNVTDMISSKRTKRAWYGACMRNNRNTHKDFIRKLRNKKMGLLLV
jgi:hypothetical protein